jgi:glycosyltransferase involved in cell wall biosynthesis
VLATGPGRRPDLAGSVAGLPAPVYLGGKNRTPAPAGTAGTKIDNPALLREVTGDMARLAGHPRRSARALRLAVYARRAAAHLPGKPLRLHAHFANDAAVLARYLAAAAGLRYTVTAHAYDIYSDPFLLAPNLAAATRVFTVSEANMNYLEAGATAGGWDAGRLRLLHCGLELDRLPYRDPPPPAAPENIICIARLVPKKGHQVLLDAVACMVAAGRRLHLTLVGEGPGEAALRESVARLGLEDQVTLLGALDNQATLAALRRADLCVLAARVAADGDRDGLPVVLMEAAALGIPLVATRVGGIPELVDEACGWPAPPDDPQALAGAMTACLDGQPSERTARTRRARQRIEEQFNVAGQVVALTAGDLWD